MIRRSAPAVAGACVLWLCFLVLQVAAAQGTGAGTAQAAPAQVSGSTTQDAPSTLPLTLEAAVQQALAHNPQVTAAQQSLVAAQAGVVTARAGLAPSISLTGTGTYGTSGSQSGVSQGLVSSAATPNTAGAVSITGTLPLFDGGKTQAEVQQAEAAVAAAQATLRQTQQSIALEAATNFFSVLKAERTTTVREAQLAQAQQQLAQAEAQFRAGTAAQADVIQAQAQVAQAQVDLLNARNQIDTTKAALRSALGLEAEGPVELQEPVAPPAPTTLTAEAAIQEALQNRPEVAGAIAAVQSNQGALNLANVQAGVQISLGLNAGYVPYSTNAFANNTISYGVTATVALPLFDSGKGQAAVNAAKANLSAAQAKLEQTRLTVRQDAYQAYLAAVQGAANVAATAAAQKAAGEALRVAEGRYQAGVATIVEVTTSRATAAQADVNAVNALFDYQTALATLRHATGRAIVGGTL